MMASNRPSRVLGFDARCHGTGPRSVVFEGFQLHFPVSVDKFRWPPLIPAYECPDDLWTDLGAMRARLAEKGTSASIIAIELFAPPDTDVDMYPSPLIYATVYPEMLPVGAVALGFDIADVALRSELYGLPYLDQDRYLNALGLIEDENLAFEYRANRQDFIGPQDTLWVYRLHLLAD